MDDPNNPDRQFSLVVGGPFHTALRRLGLTGTDLLPTWRAAAGLALFSWLLPGLLAAAQSLLDPRYSGWAYFADLTVYARYLVAIFALVATERYADGHLNTLTRNFQDAHIFKESALPAYMKALAIADRRSSSAVAEGVILLLALGWSIAVTQYVIGVTQSSWEGNIVAGDAVLSWAGQATSFVSNTLFLFLVLRWFWRFGVWTGLLYRISRMPLHITPMHPDGVGGLGFMRSYPGIFSGLAFALSCVIAASILKELGLVQHPAETVWVAVGLWLALNVFIYVGPLLVFAGPLYAAREHGLVEYGRLANQLNMAFHQKWIDEARHGKDLLGSPDLPAASGLSSSIQTISSMGVVPVDRAAIVQLLVTAGIPMLAVVVTLVPAAEILKWMIGKIL